MSIRRVLHARHAQLLHGGILLALIPLGYASAFLLRFEGAVPPARIRLFWQTVPIVVVVRLAAVALSRLDRSYWHHFGLADCARLLNAVSASSVLLVAVFLFTGHLGAMPRSVLVLDWMCAVLVLGGTCSAVRAVWEWRGGDRPPSDGRRRVRTLIIGAGAAGERFIRHVRHEQRGELHVVGFVDDGSTTHGMTLHGVPVLGGTDALRTHVGRTRAGLLVIAIPSATGEQMRRIVKRCARAGAEFKVLPSLDDLLTGHAAPDALRPVQLEDLLGRPPVSLDLERVRGDLSGRVVAVTGGAGSIGSELARQIARLAPRRLVVVDRAESPLFMIQQELRRTAPDVDVAAVIADVTSSARLDAVFAEHAPELVFHAAAYKHVPLMEAHAAEAVRNNVLGTLVAARCAARHGARKFVLISSDKAVCPSSVMGATKRVAEQIVLGWPAHAGCGTDFRAVRFGNVLGSDGSVVPLFKRQLAAGGPLTVTHPEVRRYFMTIPEAVQLVLQAAALPEAAGRICMLEMGKAVRIVELAQQLVRLSGLVPYRDVQIVFTGLRPGEKLDEELVAPTEGVTPTSVEKVRLVATATMSGALLERAVARLLAAAADGAPDAVLGALRAVVPEYARPSLVTAAPRDAGGAGVAMPADAEIPLAVAGELRALHGGPPPRRRARVSGGGEIVADGADGGITDGGITDGGAA